MSKRPQLCRKVFPLVLGLTALLFLPAPSSAAVEDKEGTKLALTTGYLSQRFAGAHRIMLKATLDDKGGKGTLALDPNTYTLSQFGDHGIGTLIGFQPFKVSLEVVQVEDPAQKGRRLYEIKGPLPDQVKSRLFLVVPAKGAGSYRLISQDKGGFRVAPLEPELFPDK